MTHGERRSQIGSWPAIEEAVKHGMKLHLWYDANQKRFHAMLCTTEEEIEKEVGNTLEWALDHLENALNDEP